MDTKNLKNKFHSFPPSKSNDNQQTSQLPINLTEITSLDQINKPNTLKNQEKNLNTRNLSTSDKSICALILHCFVSSLPGIFLLFFCLIGMFVLFVRR